MHLEILTKSQRDLLPLVKIFRDNFYLVGGTATVLQIGHRRSIDFDLFTNDTLKPQQLKNRVNRAGYHYDEIFKITIDEFTGIISGVKFTFYNFPYVIEHPLMVDDVITMPELLDLAAMKAGAMAGRAKWKDYVDTYFLLRDHFSFTEITDRAEEIFHDMFSEKLFREQLCYFDDVDYSETIEFIGEPVSEKTVKTFLSEIATS